MKKIYLCFILFITNYIGYSQAFQAVYTYDDNGNRLTATVIWLQSSLKSDMIEETVNDSILSAVTKANTTIPQQGYASPSLDSVAGTKITIYPNPTHGVLLVKLDGIAIQSQKENGTDQSMSVYDISGIKIMQLTALSQLNSINLQSQTAGTYILTIQLGSLSKTYTIIKN
jgi:hypothetical protein